MIRFFFSRNAEAEAKLKALDAAQAIIEFAMDGTILTANANFLNLLGYSLEEVKGKKHVMFVDPSYAKTPQYAQFWDKLRRGEADAAQYKRLGKGGREVWIEASYNPIRDRNGQPYKVVKFAVDVTKQKLDFADMSGQVAAIGKSQAVIAFGMDGVVLEANDNFLKALGYGLDEIKGKNHRMFVEPAYGQSRQYQEFWDALRRGEFQQAQYKRIGKGGREVWIEASYNPIFDLNGKPFKVVKYATDITEQVKRLADLKSLIDVNFTEIDGALSQSEAKASGASIAAADASANVQMVASAAEELAASIGEISSSMSKSQAASDDAYQQTANADDATKRLAEAASAMNGIVGLIQNIASQINLLALNATIESARAGDAGKGFAVVANEVKSLANQAANATEQIGREIDGMQSISGAVVRALEQIRSAIGNVQEYVSATASAVEEQAAVTQSMSSNMQGAAGSVTTIAENIGEISSALHQVGQAVQKTKSAAEILAR
mgnify:CR=1 FL=1